MPNLVQENTIQRHTSLSANMVAFCQFLRSRGFKIGPSEIADTLLTLEILQPFSNVNTFELALQTILAKTHKQQSQFSALFQEYWKELEKALDSKVVDQKTKSPDKKPSKQEAFMALKNWLHGNKANEEEQEVATYSEVETFTSRSFTSFSDEELEEVVQIIRQIARKLARKVARRKQKSNKTQLLDIKRTLRLNLRRGGEIIDLVYRKPKKNKWKIILLCDISQSMELYSRFLIQFIYSFQSTYPNIETFVFSTSITRITEELKEEEAETALKNIGDKVTHWSGGTKIGDSLQEFVVKYAYKLLDSKTFVMILSDGWDIGDTQTLEESMQHIKRKSNKVIWLNPLAGNPNYTPNTKGMQTALPYIDIFASVHNIDSLKQIIKYVN